MEVEVYIRFIISQTPERAQLVRRKINQIKRNSLSKN